MSETRYRTGTARQAKHARFQVSAKVRTSHTRLLIGGGLAILVAVLIVAALMFALNQGSDQARGTTREAANTEPVPATDSGRVQSRYTPVRATDGVVRWPLTTFDDGEAHYYSLVDGGKSIDFFILKSSDGVVRAAFDACDVCFPAGKGYRQQGDLMICNNCGQQFPSVRINEIRGGCNPAPLERRVEGTELVIRGQDIVAGVGYF